MKSEPSEFSIDDLEFVQVEPWDGVRNYQVRNMFRDNFFFFFKALFYHSNTKHIGVVGEMEVVKEAYPDQTQFDARSSHYDPKSDKNDPRWLLVDVQFVSKFPRVVTLDELKADKKFATLPIVRKGNRLSVVEITKKQYEAIVMLANK